MAETRDVVIIGGGHNGLVTAFYLAKAGFKPLIQSQSSIFRLRSSGFGLQSSTGRTGCSHTTSPTAPLGLRGRCTLSGGITSRLPAG